MNRRGFLGAILAAGGAPAIVRADALMRIVPRGLTFMTGTEILARQNALFSGQIGRYEGVQIHGLNDLESGYQR